jgi:hypothetical protein
MTMTSLDTNFSSIENMEQVERSLRCLLGLGMIVSVLVIPSLSEQALADLSMLSIYIMFTAITGWDPIYALIRKPLHRSPPIPPTATIHPLNSVDRLDREFKKAA